MKIRTGFVSNSSSSSFVVLGYKLQDYDLEKLKEFLEEGESEWEFLYERWEQSDKYEYLTDSDHEGVIGENIVYCSDYEMEADEISFTYLEEKRDALIKNLKDLGIEVKNEDVKIYTGTKMC